MALHPNVSTCHICWVLIFILRLLFGLKKPLLQNLSAFRVEWKSAPESASNFLRESTFLGADRRSYCCIFFVLPVIISVFLISCYLKLTLVLMKKCKYLCGMICSKSWNTLFKNQKLFTLSRFGMSGSGIQYIFFTQTTRTC